MPAYVPPWLSITPAYFLDAIRAGSQAGSEMAANALRARSISEQAGESAARTSLGYAQLGQRAGEAAGEQQLAAARLREAEAQQAGLLQYRSQLEENRQRDDIRNAELLRLAQDREDLSREREDRAKTTAKDRENQPKIMNVGLDVVSYDPSTKTVTPLYRAKPTSSGSRLADILGLSSGTGTSLPGAGATPTAQAKPLPKSQRDLVKGEIYQTKYGPAEWDGEKFLMPQK